MFTTYSIADFVPELPRSTEFLIDRFEEMPETNGLIFPHKHLFYELLFVRSGKSHQTIDYDEYLIQPNTLFFISPGQLHLFEEWDEIEGFIVMFTEDFFLKHFSDKDYLFELSYLDNLYSYPALHLTSQEVALLQTTFQMLYNEYNTFHAAPKALSALLFVLLYQIQRTVQSRGNATFSKRSLILFKKFRTLLDEHFSQHYSVGDYAEALHVTQHHLNHVVKQVTNKTASEIIRARTVLEAKRFLTFTDSSMWEIAERLGFEDASYFTRVFKKETRQTPLQFRQEISEKHQKTS
jgi:AraC-like DNA-binding protein